MIHPPSNLLSLELQMPTRWALGEEGRAVRLRLRNDGAVDLKNLRMRGAWWGAAAAEWHTIPFLRRGMQGVELLRVPAPAGREDHFHVEVQVRAAPHLLQELRSAQVDVQARPRPGAGGPVNVVLNADIGAKAGFGMMAAEGPAVVGHQVHVHGVNVAEEFENWLAADAAAREMRPVALYIAQETCQSWTNAHEMELAGLGRGEFTMGAAAADAAARPEEKSRREVCLTRSFWMGRHPVTNAQWAAVMQTATPVTLKGHMADRMPVANLTWGQAVDFCARLTKLERDAGTLPPGYAYRLPTEAEWEYACRAGCAAPRYGPLAKIGSVQANGGHMKEAGSFEPNAWGLHDMLGLVFEWCLDAHAPYQMGETTDPVCWNAPGGQPLHRVIRGGCYQGPDEFARASARYGRAPQSASHRVGFRVVLARE
ncbi:formylglycine-generating enzyme family protein [Prosthecobacter sp.]|uniref:formylglycine-generating enzyme family protein n=1 Tax=Prosthecobacter sp. TaxID=1965333 RepID=UPI003783B574